MMRTQESQDVTDEALTTSEEPVDRGGRPREGLAMVARLGGGSADSRKRLTVILKTLMGEQSVDEACHELELSRSRFHEIRSDFLRRAPELLERGVPGPTPAQKSEEVEGLEHDVETLERSALSAELREELLLLTSQATAEAERPAKPVQKRGFKRRPRKSRGRRR